MKDKLYKVIMWRILSILITFTFLFVATGDVKSASGLTLLLHCILTVSHLAFETLWERIHVS